MDKYLMNITGTLGSFWETGMENGMGVTVHDNRGITRGPSFNNETKKWDGPDMDFHSFEWTVFLDNKHIYIAKIFNKDGEVIYNDSLTGSKEQSMDFFNKKGIHMFVPEEMNPDFWYSLIQMDCRVELKTNHPPEAILNKYNIKYRAGTVVYDLVSKEHTMVVGVVVDKDDKINYYISNSTEDGVRRPNKLGDSTLSIEEYFEFKEKAFKK